MQQLHTSGVGTTIRCRARRWRAGRQQPGLDSTLIELLAAEPDRASVSVQVLSPPDGVYEQRSPPKRVSRRRWMALAVGTARAHWHDGWPRTAIGAAMRPLAYQWVPAIALLSGRAGRVLLADAVGLGKTIQAGIAIAEFHALDMAARTLVVLPASLLPQWDAEMRERFGLQPITLDADDLRRRSDGLPAHEDFVMPGELCLVSLDTLRLPEVTACLARVRWQLVVVDEAHLLSPGTARRAAVEALLARCSQLLLMTATPVSGSDGDETHLLRLGRQAGRDDRMLVIARRTSGDPRPAVRQRFVQVRSPLDEQRVHALIAAYVARAVTDGAQGCPGRLAAYTLARRACSSIEALRTSLHRRIAVVGTPPPEWTQASLPLDGLAADEDDAWLHVPAWSDVAAERAFLLGLAHTVPPGVPGAKLHWVARWLRRCREPVIVFTEFADTLRAVRRVIGTSRDVVCLLGAQTAGQRRVAIDEFCRGTADLLLATDAAAEGLNLHHRCRLVLHIDVPWSPRRLAQRNGRVDRIGQARPVRVLILAGTHSHDGQVMKTLTGRQERLDAYTFSRHPDLASVASTRREQIASAALSCARRVLADTSATATAHVHAVAEPSQWHRLRRRLGLPTSASSLGLIEIAATGTHPLAPVRRWLALATVGSFDASTQGVSDLHCMPAFKRLLARALARSSRFDRRDAARAPAIAPDVQPDLFGVRHHDTPAVTAGAHPPRIVRLQVVSTRVLACRR